MSDSLHTTSVSLRRVCPSASFVGCADVRIAAVTERSGECRPGTLFAAIPGTRVDGTEFVAEALANGATAVLTERPLSSVSVPQCIVPSVRAAYARICSAIRGNPSRRLGVVGVTGTNGKTTVTWLVRSILQRAGHRCGLIGTIAYDDGCDAAESSLTTPNSADLAEWFARMVANRTQYAAIELSSHALHQGRAAGTELAAAIVTNVTRDHFDYHAGPDDYLAAKTRITELLGFDGRLILNADDPGAVAIAERSDADRTSFGIDAAADVTAEIADASLDGTRFQLRTPAWTGDVHLPLVGRHNVSNALAATAACLHLGVDRALIVAGLESAPVVPGRLERVEIDRPFDVFVDYAHTPDALDSVLASLRPLVAGRLICVVGAGGDRDRAKRPEMGRAAGRADVAIVTSDNPRGESPELIIDDILAGLPTADTAVRTIVDRREAIERAIEIAEPGDCIVVAGKGHERVQVVGNEQRPFDDRDVVLHAAKPTGTVPAGAVA